MFVQQEPVANAADGQNVAFDVRIPLDAPVQIWRFADVDNRTAVKGRVSTLICPISDDCANASALACQQRLSILLSVVNGG